MWVSRKSGDNDRAKLVSAINERPGVTLSGIAQAIVPVPKMYTVKGAGLGQKSGGISMPSRHFGRRSHESRDYPKRSKIKRQ